MPDTLPVFRKGVWETYSLPVSPNPLWSYEHILKAGSFYSTALSLGYTASDSSVYAEAYVNKLIYPGLQYSSSLERTLQSIMDRAETA
jgi:hypothetical protein